MAKAEHGIRQAAIRLAMAGGVEMGLQVLMPVILVRYLDVAGFGHYRLLWLMALTTFAIAPCFMPQSMFYLLPRAAEPRARAILLGNTLVYLVTAGLLGALLTSGWNPWMPAAARELFTLSAGKSALFIGLWTIGSLFDVLPTADGHARWQARATVLIAVFRTAALGLAAFLTGDVDWVIGAMLAVIGAKLLALLYYIGSRAGPLRRPLGFDGQRLRAQLHYALPFALGNALFLLRAQADQWVVASLLSTASYAMFSIGAVLQPVGTLIRAPVLNAVMARLNAACAAGDKAEAASLLARSNGSAAFFLLPVAGGLMLVAPELVEIIYTRKYLPTVPVMQVYLGGMMLSSFALSHALPALNQGRFVTLNNGVSLVLSVATSLAGVHYCGMLGAALGSVLTLGFSELWSARLIALELGTPLTRLLALRTLGPTLLAVAAGLAAGALAGAALSLPAPLLLLCKGGAYALVAGAVLLALGGRRTLMAMLGRA